MFRNTKCSLCFRTVLLSRSTTSTSVAELRNAFQEAVTDYLDTCARLGRAPQKPYSGNLSLRLAPALHATVAVKAQLAHKSINQWVADVLDREVHA